MNWQVRWSKEQKENARARNLALFGLGVSGECCGHNRLGRYEFTGVISDVRAAALFKFVMDLWEAEKSPREAFEGINWETGLRRNDAEVAAEGREDRS